MIEDVVINPVVGVYIPIVRIPCYRWDDHPQYRGLDPGRNFAKLRNISIRHRMASLSTRAT